MQIQRAESMPATSGIKPNEMWVVVVRKRQYELNGKEADLLKRLIVAGNRGIIWFKDFAISIPYIEEIYKIGEKGDPNDPLVKAALPDSV